WQIPAVCPSGKRSVLQHVVGGCRRRRSEQEGGNGKKSGKHGGLSEFVRRAAFADTGITANRGHTEQRRPGQLAIRLQDGSQEEGGNSDHLRVRANRATKWKNGNIPSPTELRTQKRQFLVRLRSKNGSS